MVRQTAELDARLFEEHISQLYSILSHQKVLIFLLQPLYILSTHSRFHIKLHYMDKEDMNTYYLQTTHTVL